MSHDYLPAIKRDLHPEYLVMYRQTRVVPTYEWVSEDRSFFGMRFRALSPGIILGVLCLSFIFAVLLKSFGYVSSVSVESTRKNDQLQAQVDQLANVVSGLVSVMKSKHPLPQAAVNLTNENFLTAEIMVEKANLRSAPTENSKVIMGVGQGTKLLVEEQLGSWYKVRAPSGESSFVSASVAAVGLERASS